MQWDNLSLLGKNKLIKTSIIWVILIPIIVKAMPFLKETYNLEFDLAFSWQIFYYAALIFMIANLLFQYNCPKIIYENNSYSDFNSKGLGIYRLLEYCNNQTDIESKIEVHIEKKTKVDEREMFSQIYNGCLKDKVKTRLTIKYLYFFGLGLFAIVSIQNIWVVIKFTINHFSS